MHGREKGREGGFLELSGQWLSQKNAGYDSAHCLHVQGDDSTNPHFLKSGPEKNPTTIGHLDHRLKVSVKGLFHHHALEQSSNTWNDQ